MGGRDELLALADRCEAAALPSSELDARIRRAVYAPDSAQVEQSKFNGAWVIYDGVEHRSGRPRIWEGPGRMQPFTASLDAAMTLVDAEAFWRLGNDGEGADVSAFKATVTSGNGPDDFAFHDAVADTPALALCAAALRARSATQSPIIKGGSDAF